MVRASHRCHFMISLFSSPPCSREGTQGTLELQRAPTNLGEPSGLFHHPAQQTAPSSSVSGPAPLGPRPCPRWAAGPRRENPRTRVGISPPWAPNGSNPVCRTPPVYAAVSPPNPPRPHSYPGEKARTVAPAPLCSCRNFVRS